MDSDGDGWREYNGEKLSYVATCPNGWSDWQAAIEVVAAAGKEIGIDITTNFPEWSVYQTIVTKSDSPLPEGYDIFMMWSDGAGPTQPWGRIRKMMSSEFVGMASNWNGNWGQYSNPAADELINAIPSETDPAKLKELYTELVKIYLTDIPSFTLMYRPQSFHTVNESVWTGYPLRRRRHQPARPAAQPDRRLEHRRSLQPDARAVNRSLVQVGGMPTWTTVQSVTALGLRDVADCTDRA